MVPEAYIALTIILSYQAEGGFVLNCAKDRCFRKCPTNERQFFHTLLLFGFLLVFLSVSAGLVVANRSIIVLDVSTENATPQPGDRNVQPAVTEHITELLVEELKQQGIFRVIPRNLVVKTRYEMGLKRNDRIDDLSALRLGKRMKASLVVLTAISDFGQKRRLPGPGVLEGSVSSSGENGERRERFGSGLGRTEKSGSVFYVAIDVRLINVSTGTTIALGKAQGDRAMSCVEASPSLSFIPRTYRRRDAADLASLDAVKKAVEIINAGQERFRLGKKGTLHGTVPITQGERTIEVILQDVTPEEAEEIRSEVEECKLVTRSSKMTFSVQTEGMERGNARFTIETNMDSLEVWMKVLQNPRLSLTTGRVSEGKIVFVKKK